MNVVSIVIPTKNAGPEFEDTLAMVRRQETENEVEILVIDSGSSDQTLTLATKYGATIHTIPSREFSHGGTRNLGISMAKGEIVVLLVQDAIPVNNRWLNSLVRNMQDPRVAGVYSRQSPKQDCNIFTRNALENWVTFGKDRVEQYIKDPQEYESLNPMEKQLLVTFDNVSSCLRKTVWQEMPFHQVPFGEDIEWSKRVVEAGYKIVFEPESEVLHSHNRPIWYETKRTYVCHKTLNSLFGTRLVPTFLKAMGNLVADVRIRGRLVSHCRKRPDGRAKVAVAWYLKAVLLSMGMQVGMYLGGNSPNRNSSVWLWVDRILSRGV